MIPPFDNASLKPTLLCSLHSYLTTAQLWCFVEFLALALSLRPVEGDEDVVSCAMQHILSSTHCHLVHHHGELTSDQQILSLANALYSTQSKRRLHAFSIVYLLMVLACATKTSPFQHATNGP